MTAQKVLGGLKPDTLLGPDRRAFTGSNIGIIVAEANYAKLPGNVANASTYRFPVIYESLDGVTSEQIMAGDPAVESIVIAGGRRLERRGAKAVFGACGSFANYQSAVNTALSVPVFLSSMLQVPWILVGLNDSQKLLVICASTSTMTKAVFAQCRIESDDRLIFAQVRDLPQFRSMVTRNSYNPSALEDEVVSQAQELVDSNLSIAAILLQCSDLPPFAAAIQRATGLPVFDMNSLIEWVEFGLDRHNYDGFL